MEKKNGDEILIRAEIILLCEKRAIKLTVIDNFSQWSMQLSSHFTKILTAKCCVRPNNQNQVSRKERNKLHKTFFFFHDVFQVKKK